MPPHETAWSRLHAECRAIASHPTFITRASRYSRYEPDRRSRSPRDRSVDRFDRSSQYDGDRRRSSAETRSGSLGFQANRDSFGDPLRREPPRGPKALEPPSGPRGGSFSADFRGGRARGRGRAWSARDDSRDRGRERDIDYRDRYRDDRSRERDRDRDRDRDWRDSRDFRSRRSPPARPRSPLRDFRDRDREALSTTDADRARRGSRDAGPPSAGSASSDPQFGAPPLGRGSGFMRGRARGGRDDWSSADRGRGRSSYDDRGDRYPRSRSQEGRWIRERDDRDRGDRYPEIELRRDSRDDRDRGERDLIRPKKDGRPSISHDLIPHVREVSPPPVAPSAPAFGTVPSRVASSGDGSASGRHATTASLNSNDRPTSAGHDSAHISATGPTRNSLREQAPVPVGPRVQQQRPSSKQWINPNLRKTPNSPQMSRPQPFSQNHTASVRRRDSLVEQQSVDNARPRSSDAKSDARTSETEDRDQSRYSAEPGEILARSDSDSRMDDEDLRARSHTPVAPSAVSQTSNGIVSRAPFDDEKPASAVPPPSKRKQNMMPRVHVLRFSVPPRTLPSAQDSESDDDDMADYFDMEIQKTEAELSKLPDSKFPQQLISHYAAMSHGAMALIVSQAEGLTNMLGSMAESSRVTCNASDISEQDKPESKTEQQAAEVKAVSTLPDADAQMEDSFPNSKEPPQGDAQATNSIVTSTDDVHTDAMDIDEAPTEAPATAEPVEALQTSTAPASLSPCPSAVVKEEEVTGAAQDVLQDSSLPQAPPEPQTQPGISLEAHEDDDETESEGGSTYMKVETVRQFMKTPPVDSLPPFDMECWTTGKEMLAAFESDAQVDEFVGRHLRHVCLEEIEQQSAARSTYATKYTNYLRFTMSDDPAAAKSREKFSVSTQAADGAGALTPDSRPEGRGTGRRFATERDLERVLQASMREDEERKERELRAQKEKYRSDKEAVIPDMVWSAEQGAKAQFIDRSGFTPPDKLVSAWQVLPPVNNFTEQEADLFEKRYLELPKQWGKIAEEVPNRDFGTCIQYYYLRKKELNLKEKLKKQPKRRKKGGRGKQRSSALVSELGNGEQEGEEAQVQETGDNGERRRPRRAAAPTWGFEQPVTDSENVTPAGTPGRRGASSACKGEQPEKVDGRKGRRKTAKDKEAKAAKANQALAAAPTPPATGRGRSRSSSRAPNSEFHTLAPPDAGRMPVTMEQPQPVVPPAVQQGFLPSQHPTAVHGERSKPLAVSSMSDVMAAPSLRPEPPPPPPQPSMSTLNLTQAQPERKPPAPASSYWSVAETTDFPLLLRAFGSDWPSIANHMGSKTAVMVKNYFVRQKDRENADWDTIVQEADSKRARGEKCPDPPL
ncbi:hypothetical protein CDD82_3512 [Ophiocordyceps australis]|uniref:SANT domain-containing protein n=1 Tax=Ophiocordyceps australis TaxID=1399860 RepID=A0A2C5ZTB9_9HYPO|nr:hypothetical protein CDD82_3512 [Ophiocordyceps australis]